LIVNRLLRFLKIHFSQVSWSTILILFAAHAALSWVLLVAANESALTKWDAFVYYYMVTTSTVGFGDMSPTTAAGKWIVALVQIPLGLAIFGALLGKLGQSVTKVLRQVMTGDKDFSYLDTHILIFGWHETRTARIVEHILGDKRRMQRTILLCVVDEMEHPFPDNPMVEFARLSSFTDNDELERVNVTEADRIIVDCITDDMTFTCSLKLSPLVADDCHISAYFNDETKVEMLNKYTTNVECNSSKTAEILVRSMQDPGSGKLHDELISTLHGNTQFSTQVPENIGHINFGQLFYYLKQHNGAILLAIAKDRVGSGMKLNPDNEQLIVANDVLHYVAPDRILAEEIDWASVNQVANKDVI
jgi:voltage-gated potassium channel